MTDSRTVGRPDSAVTSRAVIVSAKGAARWQARHPWIYRADVYDEPRDAPGVVTVTDRRGRHLGQALYSPASEIRLRLLTTGRQPIDATCAVNADCCAGLVCQQGVCAPLIP